MRDALSYDRDKLMKIVLTIFNECDYQTPTFFWNSSNLLARRVSCELISLLFWIMVLIWFESLIYSAFWVMRKFLLNIKPNTSSTRIF